MKSILNSLKEKFPFVILAGTIILFWWLVARFEWLPSYVLPPIKDVVAVFFTDFKVLFDASAVTISEATLGLIFGMVSGFVLSALMDGFEILHKAIYPLLVVTQAIPVVALAPMFVLIFGYGMLPKIVLTSVCCFFPITISLLNGFKSPDESYFRLLKTMEASKIQIFLHIKLPFSVPYLISGTKIATTYAIISAVISEWVGGDRGLGVYMTRAKNSYAFDKLFAVVILICAVSILLVKFINFLNNNFLKKLNFRNTESQNV